MPNKFHARRTELDGYQFDSQAEARRYRTLRLLERAGEIRDLEVHPPSVTLLPAFRDRWGRSYRAISYRADFRYWQGDQEVVEDVKGVAARDFSLRRRLFQHQFPAIRFDVIQES